MFPEGSSAFEQFKTKEAKTMTAVKCLFVEALKKPLMLYKITLYYILF